MVTFRQRLNLVAASTTGEGHQNSRRLHPRQEHARTILDGPNSTHPDIHRNWPRKTTGDSQFRAFRCVDYAWKHFIFKIGASISERLSSFGRSRHKRYKKWHKEVSFQTYRFFKMLQTLWCSIWKYYTLYCLPSFLTTFFRIQFKTLLKKQFFFLESYLFW